LKDDIHASVSLLKGMLNTDACISQLVLGATSRADSASAITATAKQTALALQIVC
jgi:hypothetical protein